MVRSSTVQLAAFAISSRSCVAPHFLSRPGAVWSTSLRSVPIRPHSVKHTLWTGGYVKQTCRQRWRVLMICEFAPAEPSMSAGIRAAEQAK